MTWDMASGKEHERSRRFSEPNGRSYCYVTCPFCGLQCRAFVWSLAGSGKNCPGCDAIHGNYGKSYKKKGGVSNG